MFKCPLKQANSLAFLQNQEIDRTNWQASGRHISDSGKTRAEFGNMAGVISSRGLLHEPPWSMSQETSEDRVVFHPYGGKNQPETAVFSNVSGHEWHGQGRLTESYSINISANDQNIAELNVDRSLPPTLSEMTQISPLSGSLRQGFKAWKGHRSIARTKDTPIPRLNATRLPFGLVKPSIYPSMDVEMAIPPGASVQGIVQGLRSKETDADGRRSFS